MGPHATNGRLAVVTGSSGGFGMLICIELAKAGYEVAATMRNLQKKEALLRAAESCGVLSRIHCFALDVAETDRIGPVIDSIVEAAGPPDVLVNNAGFAQGGFVEEVPMEAWRRQMETNFFGLVAVTRAVLPYMRERRRGTVIHIGSISGQFGLPGYGPYAASKFAVEGFSEALRLEMRPFGVHVVLVEPGAFQTGIWHKGFADLPDTRADSPYRKMLERLMHLTRHTAEQAGDPARVAALVRRLADHPSPRLRYPVGFNVKAGIRFKSLMPWKLYESWMNRLWK